MTNEALIFPATIIVDTREQLCFTFTNIYADASQGKKLLTIPMRAGTLKSGDYSLEGFENLVAVERKSIDDLFSTIAHGRKRFEAELARLNEMKFAAVVIEADWDDIFAEPPVVRSQLPYKIVYRSILAWMQRYTRCHWLLMPSRRIAEVTTFRILERFLRDNAKIVWGTRSRRTLALKASEQPQATEPDHANHTDAETGETA